MVTFHRRLAVVAMVVISERRSPGVSSSTGGIGSGVGSGASTSGTRTSRVIVLNKPPAAQGIPHVRATTVTVL